MNYIDYIMETTQKLLAIPSPSGFTHHAAAFVKEELESMGYTATITVKGAVLADLGGKEEQDAVLLADGDTDL